MLSIQEWVPVRLPVLINWAVGLKRRVQCHEPLYPYRVCPTDLSSLNLGTFNDIRRLLPRLPVPYSPTPILQPSTVSSHQAIQTPPPGRAIPSFTMLLVNPDATLSPVNLATIHTRPCTRISRLASLCMSAPPHTTIDFRGNIAMICEWLAR